MMADEEDVVAAKSQHLEISDDESISCVEMFVRFTPVTECILEHLPNPCALMRTCKDVHHMVMNYIPLALVRKRARVIHTPQGRGFSLSSAPPIFRVDKDLAMMAVYRHALDYALLDPYLQNDFRSCSGVGARKSKFIFPIYEYRPFYKSRARHFFTRHS